jgi:uncharacterized protein (UPF0548 family)
MPQQVVAMFFLTLPTDFRLKKLALALRAAPYSYAAIGCTDSAVPPANFWRDEARFELGRGQDVFNVARDAVLRGECFPPQLVRLHLEQRHAAAGDVALVIYSPPFPRGWFIMPTRVIETFDERVETADGEAQLAGFTYGTLTGHLERGEERFEIEWRKCDDVVSFRIVAISRPAAWLAWLGFPYTRWEQARFRRLAGKQMREICE